MPPPRHRFGGYAPGAYTKAESHQDYEHMYALHLSGEERPASRGERVTPLYDRLAAKGCEKWTPIIGQAEP